MNWLKGAMWRLFFAAILIGGGYAYAANNFPLTVGSGTTFASLLISAVEYPIHVLCDATAGETQCQAVNSSGQASVLEANSAAILAGVTAAIPGGTNNIGSIIPGTLANGATFVSGTTAAMTGTTSTQVIAAVTSNRIYVTRVKCNNSSGTATLVQIRDGSAGTILDTLAAGATYGGEQGTGPTPLFWTTAGNALFAQDVTTGASVICTASGYSG